MWVCLVFQEVFQLQVVSRRQGEFERLKRLREERLAEERAMRSQEREIRRKKEYFKRLEEQRLLKIQEEEEARKREGGYLVSLIISF
jgi:translation initiation factor 3 subunit A